MGGRGSPGPALRDGATVRELLPALVQAGREGARGGTGPQALPSSGHAVRAAFGGPAHVGGGARPCGSPARQLGSGSFAERDASGAAGARQQALVAVADQDPDRPAVVDAPSIDAFLAGLRTAWREGEVRPTAQPKPKQKRGRRRPDPLVEVTAQLRAWFDADPSRTGRELLDRLQVEYPG